ncbi:molybdopterin molybdotransferase MoeA [Pseudonocardia alaniniphila]|uniref:Molybdopterin molybdenumtransferase n=1 Tax=Pseudonocardia alaniniphila TaxID=75291 RepID=A0ABS9T8G5_9PSEU|nr:molybdopterin molybdotransferase MoeA [Pseudonocardia alaniniphila]MCH6164825.1 molybdopterin molybdotransferase MoeA [Pseudonocardia alaniniphila]
MSTAFAPPTTSLAWDAARERAHAAGQPLPARSVPLASAVGTVLAAPVVAPANVPPVDRSAMDGYAVCGSAPWTIVGRIDVDGVPSVHLRDGEACAVVTGTAVPSGTTAVLPDEDAVLDGHLLAGALRPGANVRRAGEECSAGEELLPAGTLVRPAVLGLVATLGLGRLPVRPRPRVAAIITGNELVTEGAPGPGRVRDAIGPMLPGLLARAGADAMPDVRLPDSRALLLEALAGTDADLVLISGSSSAGPADHLRPALDALDAELLVDGVSCRPGHPQALAQLPDGRLVVGLPGNPFAALVAFLTLALPAITAMRGEPLPALVAAPVPGGLPRHAMSTRLVPVLVGPQGAVPVGHAGSAMLRGAAVADALAVIDPGPAAAIAARLLPLDPGARPWGV